MALGFEYDHWSLHTTRHFYCLCDIVSLLGCFQPFNDYAN